MPGVLDLHPDRLPRFTEISGFSVEPRLDQTEACETLDDQVSTNARRASMT
jgi:hypothetical protein